MRLSAPSDLGDDAALARPAVVDVVVVAPVGIQRTLLVDEGLRDDSLIA
jgi:hypothetical protein